MVGGDYQGSNAGVQNAFRTYVAPQAKIKADALQQGDGGKVVVWADEITRYYGSISAKGGSQGGNGGFVEVSGKGWLDFNGVVGPRDEAHGYRVAPVIAQGELVDGLLREASVGGDLAAEDRKHRRGTLIGVEPQHVVAVLAQHHGVARLHPR